MNIVTIEERIVMIKGVQKSRSSLSFSLATDPSLKNTVAPRRIYIKQLRLNCVGS